MGSGSAGPALADVGRLAGGVQPHVAQGDGLVDFDQESVVLQAAHLTGRRLGAGVEPGPLGIEQRRRAGNSEVAPGRRVCTPTA